MNQFPLFSIRIINKKITGFLTKKDGYEIVTVTDYVSKDFYFFVWL